MTFAPRKAVTWLPSQSASQRSRKRWLSARRRDVMGESILLSLEAGLATLSFNRPEVFNAMDPEMMVQFRAAAEQVERDANVRALVLRGEGKAFLSGGDVARFHQQIRELRERA